MPASLKSWTNLRLGLFLAANAVVFVFVVLGLAPNVEALSESARSLGRVLPAGLALVVVSVVNGVVPAQMKAQLVFWRWRNPLPGSEAFTRYAKTDPRINTIALQSRLGSLPTDPRAQNTLWYQLLRENETDPAVSEAHRQFLLMRDVCVTALLMVFTLGIAVLLAGASAERASVYTGVLLLQYLLTRLSAANYGRRFVCTVLAVSSTTTGGKSG